MELDYYGLTDAGMVRANNEDYFFAGKLKEDEYLFIVADGMGGHQAGEVASRNAVTLFVREIEKQNGFAASDNHYSILQGLKSIAHHINETLILESTQSFKKNGMGTTLSALYIKDDLGYIVHVGDSRIYLFSDSQDTVKEINATGTAMQLQQLTEDHSLVGKLVKDGLITEDEARSHPKRNVLYQSIGFKKDIKMQITGPIPIRKRQKYLLCSDGLYSVLSSQEIMEFLKGNSPAQIARQLLQKANFNGGPDNISLIVIFTGKDKTPGLADTVKIAAPPPKKQKKRKPWFFLLLGLLVLLLALMIYFLLEDTDTNLPSSSITKLPAPQEITDKKETFL